MRLSRLILTMCGLAWAVTSCRHGYELLGAGAGLGDGNGLAGGPGDGDGDGNGDGDGDGDGNGDGNGDGDGDTGLGGGPGDGDGDGDGDGLIPGTDPIEPTGSVGPGGELPTLPSPDFIVNSAMDPTEQGKTTLRDAIDATLASGSHKTILFEDGLGPILVMSELPIITNAVSIYGEGQIIDFNGVSGNPDCISLTAGRLVLNRVHIRGCDDTPIRLEGGNRHSISHSTFTDNDGAIRVGSAATETDFGPGNYIEGGFSFGIRVAGNSSRVFENKFIDTGGATNSAIFVVSDGSGTEISGNLIVRGPIGIFLDNGANGVDIWHNTVVGADVALKLSAASDMGISNNILTHATTWGVDAGGDIETRVAAFDHNLYFSNASHCSDCPMGLGANTKIIDPLYVNMGADNYDLQPTSEAIDEGDPTVPYDQNNGASGSWYGTGPDIGAFETNY